jgi:hypothetical protein
MFSCRVGCTFVLTRSPSNLLGYLAEKQVSATFFTVGSRVIEYPGILINEYMAGHEISVHTWSHPVRHSLYYSLTSYSRSRPHST